MADYEINELLSPREVSLSAAALLAIAGSNDDLALRHSAIRELGDRGGTEVVNGLIALWQIHRGSDDGAIHLSASAALSKIGRSAIPALESAIESNDWRVRWHAISTLAGFNKTFSPQQLEAARADTHDLVRYAIRMALGGSPGEVREAPIRILGLGLRSTTVAVSLPTGRIVIVKSANCKTLFDDESCAFNGTAPTFFGPGAPNNLIRHEAHALTAIEHPCVPRLLSRGRQSGTEYLVREYREGLRLDRTVLSMTAANRAARELLAVLDYLHGRGIVHRDLSCPNVLITRDGSISVIDFELSTVGKMGVPGSVGRRLYWAPEISSGSPVDERADLYSAGVVLYRLCTGRLPFPDRRTCSYHHANTIPTDPRSLVPHMPWQLAAVTMKLLEKSPQDRCSAAEALQMLEGLDWSTCRPTEPIPKGPPHSRGTAPDIVTRIRREIEQECWIQAVRSCDEAAARGVPTTNTAVLRGRALLGAGRVDAALESFRTALDAPDPLPLLDLVDLAGATVAIAPDIAIAGALRAADAAESAGDRNRDLLASVTGQLVVRLSDSPDDEAISLAVLVGCTQLALSRAMEGRTKQAKRLFRQALEVGRGLQGQQIRGNRTLSREAAIHLVICGCACDEVDEAPLVTKPAGGDMLAENPSKNLDLRAYALAVLELGGQAASVRRLIVEWPRVAAVLGSRESKPVIATN